MAEILKPEYIFETSWEVCNMVGGIYTVLSTRAATLQETNPDKLFLSVRMYGAINSIHISKNRLTCMRTGKFLPKKSTT